MPEEFKLSRKPIKFEEEIENSQNEQESIQPKNREDLVERFEEMSKYNSDDIPQQPQDMPFKIKGRNIPEEFNNFSSSPKEKINKENTSRNTNVVKPISKQPMINNPNGYIEDNRLANVLEQLKSSTSIYEEIMLPSRGFLYNGENGPIDGVLKIKPMTGREEEILATPRYVKKGVAMNMIFNKCIGGYASENLLTADRIFILIYLRGISYTPYYEVEITCPFTDKKFNHIINLNSDLTLNYCPDDFDLNSLKDTLPMSNLRYSYRYSIGLDEIESQNYKSRMEQNFYREEGVDEIALYKMALQIHELEGITNKRDIMRVLQELKVGDVAHLRNVLNTPPFGVDTTINVTSKFTGEEFEIELPIDAGFFLLKKPKKT